MSETIFGQLQDIVAITTYDRFFGYGAEQINATNSVLDELRNYEFTPAPVNVTFEVSGGAGVFVPPPVPTREISEYEAPDAPPDINLDRINIGSPSRSEPNAPPQYVYVKPGGEPGALTAVAPGDAPAIADIELPAARTFTLPDAPALFDLELPEFAGLTIPTFDSTAPEIDFEAPSQQFTFEEVEYSSALLDQVKVAITDRLNGDDIGLPAAIEQALFDQARAREDETAHRAVQEAYDEFAARGFSEPNGVLERRVMQVRQNNQNQGNAASRQIRIENARLAIESLRHYVAQGVALEQVLIGKHLAAEQRRFEALQFAHRALIDIFNARVALHNAAVAGYEVDARVYRERIQAEIAKVEAYKAEVEAQSVIAGMNKTLAEIYESQVRGVLASIEAYRAEFTAALSKLEVSKTRLEAHRLLVQTYSERVGAWRTEWQAYETRVRAELGNAEGFRVAAQLYAADVEAWKNAWQVRFQEANTEIARQDLQLRESEAQTRRFIALVEGARSKVASDAQALSAEAQIYAAGGQIAAASSAAKDRSFQLELEKGRSKSEILLKNAEVNLQGGLTSAGYQIEALKAVGQVRGQLSAAALSAISVSGSVSGAVSVSDSTSKSTSESRSKSASWGVNIKGADGSTPPDPFN